jgi:outer membrane protein assembly factor BamB
MNLTKARWRAGGLGLLAASVAAGLSASASSAHQTASTAAAGPVATWGLPGADLSNTRDVKSPINANNVSSLGLSWSLPINSKGFYGVYATTPVVSKGVLYTQDLSSNVSAINLSSGKILWEHKYNSPNIGPNGVTVANGTVYGTTANNVFALQAATGEQLWTKKITRNKQEGIDMAPGYNNGTVYVSTVPGNANNFYAGNGQAILWAMNAKNGKTKWKWDEVQNLWGNKKVNSGGGQWDPPSFDAQGNLYVGVANPAPFPGTKQFPWGSSRKGSNLYTDSVVKLNANTGKLMWYYQLTPHDVADWDMNNSPILTKGAGGKQIVIDGGKAGIVIALDPSTGKLLWKRPVGVHNGNTNIGLTADSNPSSLKTPITVEPGDLGGIESQLASNGKTAFAAVNDMPVTYKGPSDTDASYNLNTAKGELVAINQANGKILWDHKFKHSAFGAVSVTNNVAFTTTYDGMLWALNTSNGKVLWKKQLSAGTNAPVMISGNNVVTAGSFVQGKGQTAQIQAFSLGS